MAAAAVKGFSELNICNQATRPAVEQSSEHVHYHWSRLVTAITMRMACRTGSRAGVINGSSQFHWIEMVEYWRLRVGVAAVAVI
jgi:hypothetical protein